MVKEQQDCLPNTRAQREVIFEFVQIGHSMKVVTVDVLTKVEVSLIAPLSASQAYMQQAALRKLRYVLAK
jgi:hypothetical protein